MVLATVGLAIVAPLSAGAAASTPATQPTTGTISGSVANTHGNPIQNVCAYASTPDHLTWAYAQTLADGTFTITGVTPDTYIVTFDACGGNLVQPTENIQPQYYNGTQDESAATPVVVTAGATTVLAPQTLQDAGEIDLSLTLPGGVSPGEISPVIVPVDNPATSLELDNNVDGPTAGVYQFLNLLSVGYTIGYEYCPPAQACRDFIGYYHGQGIDGTPTVVTPTPGVVQHLTDTVVIPPFVSTTTTLGISGGPYVAGQTVTLTATVTPASGSHVPTGTVNFSDQSSQFGDPGNISGQVALVHGVATLVVPAVGIGSHRIIASYGGDGGAASSVSSELDFSVATAPSGGGGGGGGGAAAPVVTTSPVTRVAGTDRISTAVAVSQQSFPSGNAGAVVLARADDYPDALVGGPLAAARNAPLLLTEGSTLPIATATEIKRVLPAGGTVYVLGGTSAVPASVVSQLTGFGYTVVRYSGADRYATAVAVATALGSPTTVLLATGTNFPDALAAGPAAAHVHGAILLTDGSTVPTETATYLAGAHVTYAIGGPAVAAVPSATAIVGSDRYGTAAAVATKFFPSSAVVGVATGAGFPDALAGGAQLALLGGPLLLSSTASAPASTISYLSADHATLTNVYVYGGTSVLTDAVVSQLTAAFGS